jgi:hypothetical protein
MGVRIPAEQGELIVKALEMAMDAEFVGAAESVGAALAANEDSEPIAARRADALTQIAETYMNNSKNSGSTADRYQVVVHVGAKRNDPHLDNGPHVTAVVIQEDENGEPLNIGRRSRTIPPPMRRALKVRDGGCRFPGCTNHKFVDGHHIIHWADGGETSLENLVLLCRHHHHLVHEGGFDCKRSKDGEIWFEDGKSRRLDTFSRHNSVTLEESLAWMYRKHENAGITSESCTAKWYLHGEVVCRRTDGLGSCGVIDVSAVTLAAGLRWIADVRVLN